MKLTGVLVLALLAFNALASEQAKKVETKQKSDCLVECATQSQSQPQHQSKRNDSSLDDIF